jgi:hypothetical protein
LHFARKRYSAIGHVAAGFAIFPTGCYEKPMFARRTISISGPASA